MSASGLFLVLSLICFLVMVHSQIQYPYITLRGQVLPNNSYVNIVDVDLANTIDCHTNLDTCCRKSHGNHSGRWYLPSQREMGLLASGSGDDVRQRIDAQFVSILNRHDFIDSSEAGIYSCVIDVRDDNGEIVKKTTYIGIYNSEGQRDITMPCVLTLTGAAPHFTITALSFGGPPTNVTWTRNSVVVTEGTVTVISDTRTSQYTHTLTGSLNGHYTCTVSNDKPSSASASIYVRIDPSTLTVVATTATSISLSFDHGSYNVTWKRNTSVGCSNMDEGIDKAIRSSSYNIIGLEEDSSYVITLITLQSRYNRLHVASRTITAMTLQAIPSAPPSSVSITQVTLSIIIVQWEEVECIHRNGDLLGYSVRVVSSSGLNQAIDVGDVTQATIILCELTALTEYTVSVAAINNVGIGVYSNGTTITTQDQPVNVTLIPRYTTSFKIKWNNGACLIREY